MDTHKQLATSLGQSVKSLVNLDIQPEVQASGDLSKGDFTSNVALVLFAQLKTQNSKLKTPMELAKAIADLLNTKYEIPNAFDRVEVKAPGFINFWLSKDYIGSQVYSLISHFAKASRDKQGEMILEFGDPNPFKEPHIGHLRNFAIGESLARLIEAGGKKVVRASYQGDVGMHVAKAIYGILQIPNYKSKIISLEGITLGERSKFLGECYALGSKAFEEDDDAKKEIGDLNRKIYASAGSARVEKDDEVFSLWQKGRQWSLDYLETLYKRLGIKYEKYYFESETAPVGKEIVEKHVGEVFEKDDGAIIFRGEKYGLHTRVFVNSEGNATYEGKDLALAVMKDKDFPDVYLSIIMTANEQVEYFKVLLTALKLVNPKTADKTSHLSFGFVNLKEGKMSSRTGNVVGAFWLLEETEKRLKKGFKKVSNEVLQQLSVGAVKWSMLKFSRESNISFSIEESVQIEGNSGPYMQYAYARTQSVLGKSSKTQFEANPVKNLEVEELALARIICQFENVIKETADNFSPNTLCNYLFNVAQAFNLFYEKKKVIGSPQEEQRLALTKATGEVIKEGLYLLGIEAPEKI